MTGVRAPAAPPRLGVVIPTLDEEDALPHLLADLHLLDLRLDIVVSDGGSEDGTLDIARRGGARTVAGARGRATQMNLGARMLQTPWMLFLHADSRLPQETRTALESWLESPPPCQAAHFGFSLDERGLWWTLIERGQRIRERLTGLTYGDQGLLLSRAVYRELDGIPEIPIMEDVEVVRRLRRNGGLDRIDAPLVTSARRYQKEGPLRAWLRNASLISLYLVGVSPGTLSRWYRPHGGV